MPGARRSAAIEDPDRTPSGVKRGPTVSAINLTGARREVEPWHRARLDPDFAEEHVLWEGGYRHVAGIDEVGRGCLAGPVAAAAVILPPDWRPRGLRDSKLLKPEDRRRLDAEIRGRAIAWSVAFVSAELIDRINILQATLLASTLAAARLPLRPDALILDAVSLPEVPVHQRVLVSADRLCASVAAASVVAKVARDALMERMDDLYPGYDLAGNKGYAAPEHRAGIESLGLCPLHRVSFAPCSKRQQMSLWEDGVAESDEPADESEVELELEVGDGLEIGGPFD